MLSLGIWPLFLLALVGGGRGAWTRPPLRGLADLRALRRLGQGQAGKLKTQPHSRPLPWSAGIPTYSSITRRRYQGGSVLCPSGLMAPNLEGILGPGPPPTFSLSPPGDCLLFVLFLHAFNLPLTLGAPLLQSGKECVLGHETWQDSVPQRGAPKTR